MGTVRALEIKFRQEVIRTMYEKEQSMGKILDAVYKLRQIMIHVVIIIFIVTIGAFAIWF